MDSRAVPLTARTPTKIGPEEITNIMQRASQDAILLENITAATDSLTLDHLGRYVDDLYIRGRFPHKSYEAIGNIFLTWISRTLGEESSKLRSAAKLRQKRKKGQHQIKREFVKTSRLNLSPSQRLEILDQIPSYTLPPLASPYPPAYQHICETEAIHRANHYFLRGKPHKDPRNKKKPIHMLDEQRLALDLNPDQSALIYTEDEQGNRSLVGAVIRNVCGNEDTVDMVDTVIKEAIDAYWNIRLDDTGKIVQNGFTGGSRSTPTFHWARNLRDSDLSLEAIKELAYRTSATFALFWNLVQSVAPREVVDGIKDYLDRTGISRMNGDGQIEHDARGKGEYKVHFPQKSGDPVEFVFRDVELAPPAGMSAENYARYTHREPSPHEFGVSWTTSRSSSLDIPDKECGGHFFLAKYGVRVQAAANTMIAWKPTEWHGTSLHAIPTLDDPEDPVHHQRGISIVTPIRLEAVWAEYMKPRGGYDQKEAEAALFPSHGDGHSDDAESVASVDDSEPIPVPRRSERLKEQRAALGL